MKVLQRLKCVSLKKISIVSALLFPIFMQALEYKLPEYYPYEITVENYLVQMPWQQYKSYHVPQLGWYWVDGEIDIVKATIKKGSLWEEYTLNELKKYIRPGDHVIDIGAHIGTIAFAMSHLVGEKGYVYAFETNKKTFRELYFNIHSNAIHNIKPHLCTLSAATKDYFCTESKDSSWIAPIRTLDSFELTGISVIKIDVDSYELDVLKGAKQTIAENRPVLLIEIMPGLGWSKDSHILSKIKQTINMLHEMDYEVKKIWVDNYVAVPREKTV